MAKAATKKSDPLYTAPRFIVMLGLLLLLAGAVASGGMALKHFIGLELPGCGAGSACDQAAASKWGKVPGVDVPTSVVGVAYFIGALVAWVCSFGALSTASRWMVRLGALVSVVLLAVIYLDNLLCPYCLTAHACNLLFWVMAEAYRGARTGSAGPFLAGGIVGLATLAGLVYLDQQAQTKATQKAEQQLAETTRKLTEQSAASNEPVAVQPAAPEATPQPATPGEAPKQGFWGRYRWGPERAPVRIVMFTDYQCPDCQRIETELRELQKNPSVSVIIKHFPLSSQCNPHAPGNLHPNACWAARAAQTAGILRGEEGFWQMHHWLFEQKGSFTDASFPPALTAMGYDAQTFLRTMQSAETLQRVKEDIDEGVSLGLFFTPMVFINGVELKGWNAPNALTRAVNAVLATNPPPKTFAEDPRPTALDKYMSDWREQPVRKMPEEVLERAIGPAGAPVTVVIFGDYMEPNTQEADAIVRMFAEGPGATIRYAFGHFPVDKTCNPVTQVTKFSSCRAAQIAEAVYLVNPDVFWQMHGWLMSVRGVTTDETLAHNAHAMTLDPQTVVDAIDHPEILARIKRDAEAARALGIQSIPMIFINGRYVPRMKLDGENLLPRMIEEARESAIMTK